LTIKDCTIGIRTIALDSNETLSQRQCFAALQLFMGDDEAAEIAANMFDSFEEIGIEARAAAL
jgi:hypothetical protein